VTWWRSLRTAVAELSASQAWDPCSVTRHAVTGTNEIVASSIDQLGKSARDLWALRNWADDNGKRSAS
jgi:hypothetical protein